MRLFYTAVFIAVIISLSGCSNVKLREPYASDFTTSGPLGENCFQVIVKAEPDREADTMHERRETAYIKAKKNLYSDAVNQIESFILSSKNRNNEPETADREYAKKKALSYAEAGQLEYEFYLIDDSVVLIYRIYGKGIKSEFSGN